MSRTRTALVSLLVSLLALAAACAPPRSPAPGGSPPSAATSTRSPSPTDGAEISQKPGTPAPPSKLPPVVVYSPHPDDESIAMGQAIRRWVRSGRQVHVALLTDGEDSRSFAGYYLKHPEIWRDYNGDGHAGDRADFGLSRRMEFVRATEDLGVPRDHLQFFGAAGRETRNGLRRDYFPRDRVVEIMRSYETRFPGALHVTVMKYTDGDPHGVGDAMPQQEHRASCEALRSLVTSDHVDAAFYKVYVYDLPAGKRWAPHIEDDPVDHPVKVEALQDGYDRAGSGPEHLGIGWASVPLAMRNDLIDTREYRTDARDFH